MNRTEDWLLAAGLDLRADRGSSPEGLPTKDIAEKAIAYATEIVEFVKPLLKS